MKLQRHAAALQDAEASLAAQPGFPKALYRKALALQALGRPEAAAAAAQQALQAEPGSRDAQALLRQLQAAAKAAGAGAAPPPSASAAVKPAPTAALLPPLLAGAPWEYAPPADGVHENLLLLLHGLGDQPAAFARMARQMALPQAAALALGGPQAVPFTEGRTWYTVFDDQFDLIQVGGDWLGCIDGLSESGTWTQWGPPAALPACLAAGPPCMPPFIPPPTQGRPGEQRRLRSLAQTVAALRELLQALQRGCGWRVGRVHLLGFSQGGTVALELARQQAAAGQPLGSCVAVSAALLEEQLAELQGQQGQTAGGGAAGPQQQQTTTRVLITRGSADKGEGWGAHAAGRWPYSCCRVRGHACCRGPPHSHALPRTWPPGSRQQRGG